MPIAFVFSMSANYYDSKGCGDAKRSYHSCIQRRRSRQAFTTLVAILKKTVVQLVEPSCRTNVIEFRPAPAILRTALTANAWKSTSACTSRAVRDLVRTLATIIASEPDRTVAVFFHFDGDEPWSRAGQSENTRKFEEMVASPILQLLNMQLPLDEAKTRVKQRLIQMVPFYSIEAWLFRNFAALGKHVTRAADIRLVGEWRERPETLDEIVRIKERLTIGSTRKSAKVV